MGRIDAWGAVAPAITDECDTVSGLTYSTTVFRSGTQSYRSQANTTQNATMSGYSLPDMALRFSFYIGSLASGDTFDTPLMTLTGPSSWGMSVTASGGTTFSVVLGTNIVTRSFSGFEYDTWHDFLFRRTGGTVNGNVDGQVFTQITGASTTAITDIVFGTQDSEIGGAVYMDDFILDNANVNIPHTRGVYVVNPNSTFAADSWATQGGGATLHGNVTDGSDTVGIRASGTTTRTCRLGCNNTAFTIGADGPIAPVVAVYSSIRHGALLDAGNFQLQQDLDVGTGTFSSGNVPNTATGVMLKRALIARILAPDNSQWSLADVDDLVSQIQHVGSVAGQTTVWEQWACYEVALASNFTESVTAGHIAGPFGVVVSAPLDEPATETPAITSLTNRFELTDTHSETPDMQLRVRIDFDETHSLSAETVAVKVSAALTDTAVAGHLAGPFQVEVQASLTDGTATIESTDTVVRIGLLEDTVTESFADFQVEVFLPSQLIGGTTKKVIFVVDD